MRKLLILPGCLLSLIAPVLFTFGIVALMGNPQHGKAPDAQPHVAMLVVFLAACVFCFIASIVLIVRGFQSDSTDGSNSES